MPIGVKLTRNHCQDSIFNSIAYHQAPRYPTPVLSKAKTSPPLGKGRG